MRFAEARFKGQRSLSIAYNRAQQLLSARSFSLQAASEAPREALCFMSVQSLLRLVGEYLLGNRRNPITKIL